MFDDVDISETAQQEFFRMIYSTSIELGIYSYICMYTPVD